MTEAMLVRMEGESFARGLVLRDGVCVRAASALGWAVGMRREELVRFFASRGWGVKTMEC